MADLGTIVVVEDDRNIADLVELYLRRDGVRVVQAEDGEKGIEAVHNQRPRLVVLDVGLPLLDGVGVADALRAIYGEALPIVVITAAGHAADKAGRVGAVAYLAKPFDVDELLAAVWRAVGSGR